MVINTIVSHDGLVVMVDVGRLNVTVDKNMGSPGSFPGITSFFG